MHRPANQPPGICVVLPRNDLGTGNVRNAYETVDNQFAHFERFVILVQRCAKAPSLGHRSSSLNILYGPQKPGLSINFYTSAGGLCRYLRGLP